MKTLYTLMIPAFLMVSNAHAAAELFLKVNKPGRYTVTIDDNSISSRNNIFRFYDLSAGNYILRITQNGYTPVVVYEKPIQLTEGYRLVAEINQNGILQITQQLPFQSQAWYLDQVYSNGSGNGYPAYPPPVTTTTPNCPPQYPVPQSPGHSHGNGGWNPGNGYPNPYPQYPPYPQPGGYGYPIGNVATDNTTVQSLKNTMKNMVFEDSMLQVGKSALKNMYVTTAQVSDIMSVFTFDSNKLEFAKFAYDRTIDKQNYFQLYDDFTFNSSSTDLDKYITSR